MLHVTGFCGNRTRSCFSHSQISARSTFPGCSKMPLPSPKRLRAGRQMQVEPCEIPFAGAPEILRVASRRIRSDFLPRRRVGEPARGLLQGNAADWHFSATRQAFKPNTSCISYRPLGWFTTQRAAFTAPRAKLSRL